jgi:hypothetical protein
MDSLFSGSDPILSSGFFSGVAPTWMFSLLIEAIILFRSAFGSMFRRYPFFYASVLCSFLGDVLLLAIRNWTPSLYLQTYWGFQLLTLFAACGIVLEIFKHVLSGYPGAERFARAVSIAIFVSVLAFALIYPSLSTGPSIAASVIAFERDVRMVQAIFLCVILMIILRYRIQAGRNVMGMMVGYGFYIFGSLFSLAIRAYAGRSFDSVWRFIQPFSYDACLVVWAYAMWAYAPGPAPEPGVRLESDYEALAAGTRGALGAMRSYIGRSIR